MATTPTYRRPSPAALKKAVDVLERCGRRAFSHEDDPPSLGQCVGYGLYAACDGPVCIVDAAIEGLEEWNYHLAVAALSAIAKGQGEVTRKGRNLTIVLPEHWDKI